jgi:hypothetical protein
METKETYSGLISYCGLYCTNCRSFKKGSCPGCEKNEKASWCKIRKCCTDHGYKSCADCKTFANPMDCEMFNNVFSKIFAFVFKSDRAASISMIKKDGYAIYAGFCSDNNIMVIKKS